MNYSEQISDLIMDRLSPHHMAAERDNLIGDGGNSHYADKSWIITNPWVHAHGAAAWCPTGSLSNADAAKRGICTQMVPGDIFAKGSTYHPAACLRYLKNHGLEYLKYAVVDCIAMAGCVVGAALITLLLGM